MLTDDPRKPVDTDSVDPTEDASLRSPASTESRPPDTDVTQAADLSADRRDQVRPALSTWDHAFTQLQQRVAGLIDSIESREDESRPVSERDRLDDLPENVEVEPDPLAQATEALDQSRSAEREELKILVDRLKPEPEQPHNLSGILASLPQITAAQREAVTRIDHRLELIKVRTDATADALTSAVREVEHLRRQVEDMNKAVSGCQQTESELAANQRQLAESLNVLHDLVAQATQTVKSNAAWVEMLAEAPDNRFQSLRDHLTAQTARVETKSNLTLLAAAIAAFAALIALVVVLAR